MAKQKNIDIWNEYMRLIKERESAFIKGFLGEKPHDIIYQVFRQGKIQVCYVTGINYSVYGTGLFFTGKNPTLADVAKIKKCYTDDPPMTVENIAFEYYYLWGDNNNQKASSTHFLYKPDNYSLLTLSKEEADLTSERLKLEYSELEDWKKIHQKDRHFNYNAAGYKFLGWQNGWKHVYFDEQGNQTTDPQKKRTFGYSKEDYPEYGNCIELKHRRIDVSHNNRGSEHTVSCPECKIYWKYDSSD